MDGVEEAVFGVGGGRPPLPPAKGQAGLGLPGLVEAPDGVDAEDADALAPQFEHPAPATVVPAGSAGVRPERASWSSLASVEGAESREESREIFARAVG